MKIGTIGSSVVVETFLAASQWVSGATISGIYSRSAEKAQALASRFAVGKTFTQLDDLFADREIDTIYIASPNSLHFSQARAALQAGKDVILEKPLTSTLAESRGLMALAEKEHRFLFEAISTRHLPNFMQIQRDLAELGPIRLVQCNFSQYSSRYTQLLTGEVTNVFDPVFSGGCLFDLNIYNLHFVVGLFGRPLQVHAYANKTFNGIDTSGTVVLEYDGFIATCTASKDSASPSFQVIQGEQGYLQGNGAVNSLPGYVIQAWNKQASIQFQNHENRLVYEIAAFADCQARQDWTTAQNWLEQSLIVMEVAEKARHSAGIVFGVDLP